MGEGGRHTIQNVSFLSSSFPDIKAIYKRFRRNLERFKACGDKDNNRKIHGGRCFQLAFLFRYLQPHPPPPTLLSMCSAVQCSAVQCSEMVRCSQRSVNIGSSLVLGCGAVRDVQSGALWCRVVHCGGALHRGMVP